MMQGVVIHLFGCLHGGHEHITKTLDDDTVEGKNPANPLMWLPYYLRRVLPPCQVVFSPDF